MYSGRASDIEYVDYILVTLWIIAPELCGIHSQPYVVTLHAE